MEINKIIMESIEDILNEEKQQTGIETGTSQGPSIKDVNIDPKNKTSIDKGLSEDLSEENKNQQDKVNNDALEDIQKDPKLLATVVAGIAKAGIGAKVKPNPDVKFALSEPAS